ncbi:MFS transporter [Halarsenatibacter silvermanii]|uniref:Predicted arabinose efflux permease, MFS family n=1 Tax=Halarsenatibacter silvermanii TaxID=321763 RepID=A0A1G9MF33_9FIRM|nr:MFS transporter [Halarsenatibacter silvermanii]SDL72866.1 Predicted arabinose efflux permease, MFS family [Halarsenatibacter silvermanii]
MSECEQKNYQQKSEISRFIFLIVLTMGAFGVMGGGLVAPALPAISEAFGTPEEQIGLVLSIYTISAAISLPLIGYFIDSAGRRKVALFCLLLDGLAGLGSTMAASFPVLLIWRFFQGIGVAGLIPVAMTIISDCFAGKNRIRAMGFLTGTISIGAVIIPSLGGLLASVDWRLVFMVYGLSLILGAIFFFKLPETSPQLQKTSLNGLKVHIKSLGAALKRTDIVIILLQSFAVYFFLYTLVTFLPVMLHQYHDLGEIFSGISLSMQGFIAALLASRAGVFADIMSWKSRTFFGFCLIALAFILLPFWPQGSYLVLISMVIFGAGMGILNPTIYNRVTRLPPQNLKGSVISLFNTLKYIGMSLSPLVFSLLLLKFSMHSLFIMAGITAIIWAGSLLYYG